MIKTKVFTKPKNTSTVTITSSGTIYNNGSTSYTGGSSTSGGTSTGGNSDYATNANYATTAGHATSADTSTNAEHADNADYATNANYSDKAGTANTSDYATNAANAEHADMAGGLDEAAMLELDKMYLSRQYDDTASGQITFDSGLISNSNVIIRGDTSIDGITEITGETTIYNNAQVTENLIVDGNVEAKTDLTVGGNTTLSSELETLGAAAFRNTVTIDKDTTINGTTNAQAINAADLVTASKGINIATAFKFDKNGDIIANSITSNNYNPNFSKGFTIAKKDTAMGTYKLLIDELQAWAKAQTKELVATGNVSNGDFTSGFIGGKGWSIYPRQVTNSAGVEETKWTGEFDNLICRGAMKVYEMVVSQLVGENDNRVFTGMLEVDHYDTESGKVYLSTNEGQTYNPFRTDDYIMVQRFSLASYDVVKQYELIVTDYGSEGTGKEMLAWVKFKNFTTTIDGATAEDLIQEGDTFVRMDNLTDETRKGIVQIIAVGNNAPYMDVIYGYKTDPNDSLKVRLGNLKGITHPNFGTLYGWGGYLQNMFAVGDFVLARTGENIDTKMQVIQSKFATRFQTTENNLTNADNFLANGQFVVANDGTIDKWNEINETTQYYVDSDGLPVVVNGEPTISGLNRVAVEEVNGKNVLHFKTDGTTSVSLKQLNANIKQPTKHTVYDSEDTTKSEEVLDTMYLSFRCKTAGQSTTLTVTVGNDLTATYTGKDTEWQTIEISGQWNGTGDCLITATSECYMTDLILQTQPLENLKTTYNTAIEQTSKKIQLQAERISKNETAISNLQVTADGITGDVKNYVDEKLTNYSTTEQTAQSITSTVNDAKDNLQSQITQNANNIKLKVNQSDYDTDQKALLDTGIDIANKTVSITADNFTVYNNSNEKVIASDKDGNLTVTGTVYANNGTFTGEVNATSGSIASFDIGDGYIGNNNIANTTSNDVILTKQYIHFAKFGSDTKQNAYFGAINLSSFIGAIDVMDTRTLAGDTKHGARFEVSGGKKNLAIEVVAGDTVLQKVTTQKVIEKSNFQFLTPTGTYTALSYYKDNIITFNASGKGIVLPTLTEIEDNVLQRTDTYLKFALHMTVIVGYSSTQSGTIYGRPETGDKFQGHDSTDYPYICGNNAYINGTDKEDILTSIAISRGDVLEFLLTYDGTIYCAYLLNHRN